MAEYKFLKDGEGLTSNKRDKLLAVCIAHQQSAGFGLTIDAREAKCESCGASGFNTGWGNWLFLCGAEMLSDGTETEPCGAKAENAGKETGRG